MTVDEHGLGNGKGLLEEGGIRGGEKNWEGDLVFGSEFLESLGSGLRLIGILIERDGDDIQFSGVFVGDFDEVGGFLQAGAAPGGEVVDEHDFASVIGEGPWVMIEGGHGECGGGAFGQGTETDVGGWGEEANDGEGGGEDESAGDEGDAYEEGFGFHGGGLSGGGEG